MEGQFLENLLRIGAYSTFPRNMNSAFLTWKNNIWNLFLLFKKVNENFGNSVWFFEIPVTVKICRTCTYQESTLFSVQNFTHYLVTSRLGYSDTMFEEKEVWCWDLYSDWLSHILLSSSQILFQCSFSPQLLKWI